VCSSYFLCAVCIQKHIVLNRLTVLAACGPLQIMEDNFLEVVDAVLAANASGDLAAAVEGGPAAFKKWINSVGKGQKRKGKRLFMPMRVCFTVRGAQAHCRTRGAILKT
jgi:glutamyl-tRNA synthetase